MLSLVLFMGFWLLVPLIPVIVLVSILLSSLYYAALHAHFNPPNS